MGVIDHCGSVATVLDRYLGKVEVVCMNNVNCQGPVKCTSVYICVLLSHQGYKKVSAEEPIGDVMESVSQAASILILLLFWIIICFVSQPHFISCYTVPGACVLSLI